MNLPPRYNVLGLAMIVLGGLIAGVGSFIFKLDDVVVILGIGLAVIVADLIIRVRSHSLPGWFYRSEYGGTFFFLPMWAIGCVAIVGGVINAVTS